MRGIGLAFATQGIGLENRGDLQRDHKMSKKEQYNVSE